MSLLALRSAAERLRHKNCMGLEPLWIERNIRAMLYFLVLCKPVQVNEGVFGVLQGTAAGIELKTFTTMYEARRYHESIVASFNLAIELPVQLIRVDDEDSFPVLRKTFEDVYERRIGEDRSFALASQAMSSLFRRCTDTVAKFVR